MVVFDAAPVHRQAAVHRKDIRIDTFRASGAGGQHRNKTDSCIRAVHLPTGLMTIATESRSQHENKQVALTRLTDLLAERSAAAVAEATNDVRRSILGEGRTWTWTGWRDEVKGPDGRAASMSRVLAGRVGLVL